MIYDIIDIIKGMLPKDNNNLILHRNFKIHSNFKAIKEFNYNLYLVNKDSNNLLLSFSENKKATSEDIDAVWGAMDKVFLQKLFKYMVSEEFKNILYGV